MTTPTSITRWQVESIECKDFKAFRTLNCRLNGRNLLLYGKNGSGKSSFYDALKLFVDSAKMPTDTISKRLGRGATGFANIHAPSADTTSISIQLSNSNTEMQKYTISQSEHGTLNVPHIIEAQLASDFITYRVLYDFYSTRHNDEVDLWPVFQREILPFCINSQLINVSQELQILRDMNAKQERENYLNQIEAAKRELNNRAYNPDDDDYDSDDDDDFGIRNRYLDQLAKVNDALVVVIQDLSRQANAFYQRYFGADQPLTLELGISDFEYRDDTLAEPMMSLKIKTSTGETPNPITFLNEAALTKVALSIRFGASLMMLNHDKNSTKIAGLKLLVIDDLLISLDMENRMHVIEILLGEDFADFQKIIMTHDKEFFKEITRRIYDQQTQWTIHEVNHTTIQGVRQSKTPLQKAEDLLYGYFDLDYVKDLELSGIHMRKSAEELCKRQIANIKAEAESQPKQKDKTIPLYDLLQSVIQQTMNAIHLKLYTEYLVSITREELRLVIPDHVNDIEDNQKERIKQLRINLYRQISTTPWRLVRNLHVVKQLDLSRNKILNSTAHDDSTPLYESDFTETLELLKSFTRIVHEPDMTAPLMRFEMDRIEPIDPAPTAQAPRPAPTSGVEMTPTPNKPETSPPRPARTISITTSDTSQDNEHPAESIRSKEESSKSTSSQRIRRLRQAIQAKQAAMSNPSQPAIHTEPTSPQAPPDTLDHSGNSTSMTTNKDVRPKLPLADLSQIHTLLNTFVRTYPKTVIHEHIFLPDDPHISAPFGIVINNEKLVFVYLNEYDP